MNLRTRYDERLGRCVDTLEHAPEDRLIAERAEIVFHRHPPVLNERPRITAEWVGDPRLPVLISWWALEEFCGSFERPGEWLDCFPWPLVKIEDDLRCGGSLYVRADQALGLHHLWRARFWWRRFKEGLRYRFILTLHVWGLAQVPAGSIPSWRHVGKR